MAVTKCMLFSSVYLLLLLILASILLKTTVLTYMASRKDKLTISAWNVQGLNASIPYIKTLMQSSDIIAISEHCLFENNLWELQDIDSGFLTLGRASYDLTPDKYGHTPGHAGTAILWRKSLGESVIPLVNVGSDRVCGLKIVLPGNRYIFIFSVYLPPCASNLADFGEELDKLEEVVIRSSMEGPVILVGDWNAHLGKNGGPRGWGDTTKSGKLLADFMTRNSLIAADMTNLCTGPLHTFQWQGSSQIDHCLVSRIITNNVCDCEVIDEELINTSYHLPLRMTLNLEGIAFNTKSTPSWRSAWHKVDLFHIHNNYTKEVDKNISILTESHSLEDNSLLSNGAIDKMIDYSINILHNASDKTIPKTKFSTGLKSYWSTELTQLVKHKNAIFKAWKQAGKPRSNDNNLWAQYKQAKRDFRRAQRRHEFTQEMKEQEKIVQSEEIDQKYFWKLVNKARKSRNVSDIHPITDNNGNLLHEQADICNEWFSYFSQLATPDNDKNYNDEFRDSIERQLKLIHHNSYFEHDKILQEPISHDEVQYACKKLKSNKAGGWDKICHEHVKYGGNNLYRLMSVIYNAIIRNEYIPINFKRGVAIPLFKGGNKDACLKDNYRKITLLTVFRKIFESILLSRLDTAIPCTSYISDLQGASRKGLSSINTSFLLHETINHNRNNGSDVYAVFFDTRKAFDTVWLDGLMFKLYQCGIMGKTWRLICGCYHNFLCSVLVGGMSSNWFEIKQGVHQGGVLSMRLYVMFANGLIEALTKRRGCYIMDVNVTSPTYADDLAALALFQGCLADLINIAYDYSTTWRFQFNAKKCAVVASSNKRPIHKYMLGNVEVPVKDSHTHVGVSVSSNSSNISNIQSMIGKGRRAFFSLQGIGRKCGGLNPLTASNLYWKVCVPIMMYGVEVMSLKASDIELFEQAHRKIARSIQSLPTNTSNPACLAPLGWWSIEAYIDQKKLMFLVRLLKLPVGSLYRHVALLRIIAYRNNCNVTSGPIYEMIQSCKKYCLFNIILQTVDSGVMPTKSEWHRTISSAIVHRQKSIFNISRLMYKKLSIFNQIVNSMTPSVWWLLAWLVPKRSNVCRIMMKLCVGEDKLNGNARVYKKGVVSKKCIYCDEWAIETVDHFLIDCAGYEEERAELFANVGTSIGIDVTQLSRDQKIKLLMGAEISNHMVIHIGSPKWCEMAGAIAVHVTTMYKSRLNRVTL